MGTRADFYVGRDKDAEWLGSIAWDGYPDGIPENILEAPTEEIYRIAVKSFIENRNDGTKPENGWPWPWDDSNITDYAYAFDGGKVWAWGSKWFDPLKPEYDEDEEYVLGHHDFPNMTDRKKVTLGERSGLIVITA